MPTYPQLAQEAVWRAQVIPENMTSILLVPLRNHFGLGPEAIGAPGDNNHMYGRHRSRNWCLGSQWCTNRFYGTVDPRDEAGDGDWYRAVDVGIQGEQLYAASHRLDALARSGDCPGLAEWFGTFDGQNVVGWYEGGPSSSDDSHLYHGHAGLWTGYANDPFTLRQIYAAFTGTAPPHEEDNMFHGQLPPGGEEVTIVPTPWSASQVSFGCDFGSAKLRVARHVVNEGWIDIREVEVHADDPARVDLESRAAVDRTSVKRIPMSPTDEMTTPVAYMAWWAPEA